MHTTVSQHVCGAGGEQKKKGKDKGKICPGCTCIHLECLHIFGCKYVYKKKKPRCPSQNLTLKPVNKPFAKFINVKQGIVFLLRRRENKKQKGQRH